MGRSQSWKAKALAKRGLGRSAYAAPSISVGFAPCLLECKGSCDSTRSLASTAYFLVHHTVVKRYSAPRSSDRYSECTTQW
jgi:hypothetical protein